MKLGEMAWPEVETISKDKVVLLPLGAFEQHGHHLPLLTDTLIAGALADQVEARRRERVLLLPDFWLGYSAHHAAFPGTLSIEPELFIKIFSLVLRPLAELGFGKFLVLNAHGGNAAPVKLAMRALQEQLPQARLQLVMMSDWTAAADMTHACRIETSLLLHLRPDLVKMEHARADMRPEAKSFRSEFFSFDFDSDEPDSVHLNWNFDEVTKTGALGHPENASREEGERIFEAMVQETCQFVDEFSRWDPGPPRRASNGHSGYPRQLPTGVPSRGAN